MSDKSNLIYDNHVKPLKGEKNTVWYSKEDGINKLDKLAQLIGLKGFIVVNDENGLVYSKEDGLGLIIKDCGLQLVFKDYTKNFFIKDKQGKKIVYNTDEVIIWQS